MKRVELSVVAKQINDSKVAQLDFSLCVAQPELVIEVFACQHFHDGSGGHYMTVSNPINRRKLPSS